MDAVKIPPDTQQIRETVPELDPEELKCWSTLFPAPEPQDLLPVAPPAIVHLIECICGPDYHGSIIEALRPIVSYLKSPLFDRETKRQADFNGLPNDIKERIRQLPRERLGAHAPRYNKLVGELAIEVGKLRLDWVNKQISRVTGIPGSTLAQNDLFLKWREEEFEKSISFRTER